MAFVFVDIETTHLDPLVGEMLEIAMWSERDGWYETRIAPQHLETASPEALRINGYTAEGWAGAPGLVEVLPEISRRLRGLTACGHNVQFDMGFINLALVSGGFRRADYHTFDTLALAMEHLELPSYSLHYCCLALGISNEGEHGARVDVERCLAVFTRLWRCVDHTVFAEGEELARVEFERVRAERAARG